MGIQDASTLVTKILKAIWSRNGDAGIISLAGRKFFQILRGWISPEGCDPVANVVLLD